MSEDKFMETRTESPAWTLPAIIVLGLLAIGGLAFGWNASSKLDATQQSVAAQLKTTQQAVQQDVSSLKDRLAQDEKASTDLQGDLRVVTGKLKITQGQLKKAREEAAKLNNATTEDKRFEKKNRAMNEPIFFYTSGTHIPEEMVVNKVGKNTISGYVSIPKANSQTSASASKSGN